MKKTAGLASMLMLSFLGQHCADDHACAPLQVMLEDAFTYLGELG